MHQSECIVLGQFELFVIFVLKKPFNTKATKGGHEGHKEENRK